MSGLYYFLHLGAFYFFVTMLFAETKNLRMLLKVFLISSVIFSLGSLIAKDGFGLIFAHREWSGFTFGNSTFAAMYLFAAFVLSVYYVYSIEKSSRRWWQYLFPFAIILNPYLLNMEFLRGKVNIFHDPFAILGGSQASAYALVFTMIMLLAVYGISKIKAVKIRRGFIWGSTTLGILVAILAVHSFLTPGAYLQNKYLEKASGARPLIWTLSEKAIREKPVLGWGIDNFDRAYEAHFDSRVMEKVNGAEAWFDRAHNIFIDQAIETGYVGVLIYILAFLSVIGSMLYVIFSSRDRNDQTFAVFIIVYFIGHLMELQTAFDTTISYIPLAIIAGLASIVFHRTYAATKVDSDEWLVSKSFRYIFGVLLIGIFGTLFFVGTIPILRGQIANGHVRTIGSSEKRFGIYPIIFNSPVDQAGFLNRTYNDLKRGISLTPELLNDPKKVEGFKTEFEMLAAGYEKYISAHPSDLRAHINLADLYIYERLFDINNLPKAQASADAAIVISPQIPQAYWEKSVAYLYERKFSEAREWAKKAYDLNPNIEESVHLRKYIEDSIKTFPEIDLYNFIML